jgi:DNA-binding CsgD family transcriptional regulator
MQSRSLSSEAAQGCRSSSRTIESHRICVKLPLVIDGPITARHLVGREEELGALVALLDAPEQLPGTAVLSGEAGIGKTTLWLAGIAAASSRGFLILSSRPAEAEAKFSFAGLTDLLGGSAGDVLPELPPIQRRALEAALLLGDSELYADDRAVAAAFLGAVRLLAADAPVCLAVDDVQWLDAASLAALGYVLPRLDREPVATLLAVRGRVPPWVRHAVPEDRLRTFDLHGLSVGAIHELLRTRLDATFPRPTLMRLWETSRGNPFFAFELATALRHRGGTLAAGEELPIPSDLDELLRARLAGLGAAALEVARIVAALADPTVPLVEEVVGARFDRGLGEGVDAKVLELDGRRLRFAHPLLGAAVAARQTPARRRSLNARLADVVPSAEERARHLALATDDPEPEVASILEGAARTAHARGAPAAAADLAEQALRLTPASDPDDVLRRLFIVADMHNRAGDTARAVALLEQARGAATPGHERATILAHLAAVQPRPQDAVALYREALPEAEGDAALHATIHLGLAALMRFTEGIERGMEHGQLAAKAASRVGDPALRCRALAAYGLMHFNSGGGIPTVEMQEALSLERSLAEWPLHDGPTWVYGWQLCWSAELGRARDLLQEVLRVVKARNDPAGEADALWYLGLLETRAAHWDEADRYATDSLNLWTQLGRVIPPHEFPPAVIEAHRGRIDDARARSQRAVARAEAEGIGIGQSGHSWVLGFVELSTGDAAAALPYLRRAHELRNAFMLEPAQRLELGDLLEALIAVGELGEADEILATWQQRADALDRAWALAIIARCRGLLLAARGDLEGAFASFDRALAEHARCTDPFNHARTLLALGRTQRRAKRRAAARTTLDEALAAFESLGAPLWAEQARAELARIGGRAPSDGELTEAESRIAALVAAGRTNRDVAAALFLTVHSVETALTRIYRKLGVRSRAELTHLLASKS